MGGIIYLWLQLQQGKISDDQARFYLKCMAWLAGVTALGFAIFIFVLFVL